MDQAAPHDRSPRQPASFSWIDALAIWLRKLWPGWRNGVVAPPLAPPPLNPLNPANFVGSFTPSSTPVVNGGQATYEGAMFVTTLQMGLVNAALPPGLSLAEHADPGATRHPVILMLGKQGDLCWVRNGAPIKAGIPPYTELILLIPYTVRSSGSKWHNYAVRMYLDNLNAVVVGDAVYAYAKQLASFAIQSTKTKVLQFGAPVFECDVQSTGPSVSGAPGSPLPAGFVELQQIFQMPLVGFFDSSPPVPFPPPNFPFSCSYFEWDYTNAQVAPANSLFTFVQQFKPGMQGWVALGQLANMPNGAFRLSGLRWRLSSELPPWLPNQPPACNFS
ncbi:hypothetical protein [Variovorax sp. GT1P44]|uniref:hypothetical protein n=1 Tax=Variovorax sp. GT1P44 TaxID=3443742 RepID=UPI003F458A47